MRVSDAFTSARAPIPGSEASVSPASRVRASDSTRASDWSAGTQVFGPDHADCMSPSIAPTSMTGTGDVEQRAGRRVLGRGRGDTPLVEQEAGADEGAPEIGRARRAGAVGSGARDGAPAVTDLHAGEVQAQQVDVEVDEVGVRVCGVGRWKRRCGGPPLGESQVRAGQCDGHDDRRCLRGPAPWPVLSWMHLSYPLRCSVRISAGSTRRLRAVDRSNERTHNEVTRIPRPEAVGRTRLRPWRAAWQHAGDERSRTGAAAAGGWPLGADLPRGGRRRACRRTALSAR